MTVTRAALFVVIGSGTQRRYEASELLARRAPVEDVENVADAGVGGLLGVVVTDELGQVPAFEAPTACFGVKVRGLRLLRDRQDVISFSSYCMARHYTGSDSVARTVEAFARRHALTPKQSELVALSTTTWSRLQIANVLGLSKNTIKTRCRLLVQALGMSGMGELGRKILRAAGLPTTKRLTPPTVVSGGAPRCVRSNSRKRTAWDWQLLCDELPETLHGVRIDDLDLPIKLRSFASKRAISTLHELLSHPGLPRWKDSFGPMRALLARLRANGGALPRPRSPWLLLLDGLPENLHALEIAEANLPTRLRKLAREHSLKTLSDLLSYPALPEWRATCAQTARALVALQEALPEDVDLEASRSFCEAFAERINILSGREREVIERRAGVARAPEDLATIGRDFGLSYERVRQIEGKAVAKLLRQDFGAEVARRIHDSWGGVLISLEQMSQQPWFRDIDREPGRHIFAFMVGALFEDEAGPRLIYMDGTTWLSPVRKRQIAQAWRTARACLSELVYPTPEDTVLTTIRETSSPDLVDYFWARAQELVLFGPGRPGKRNALAFGTTNEACVLALLRAAPAPMHVTDVRARLGRCEIPDEVIYFGAGYIGLTQHFPELERWRAQLAPRAVEHMRSAPQRQWNADEIMRAIKQDNHRIPDWFSAWHLIALLRRTHEVRYLKRRRFVLASSQVQERLHYVEAIDLILREHGPLAFSALVAQLRVRMDCTPNTVRKALDRQEFERLGADKWRLRRTGRRPTDNASRRS